MYDKRFEYEKEFCRYSAEYSQISVINHYCLTRVYIFQIKINLLLAEMINVKPTKMTSVMIYFTHIRYSMLNIAANLLLFIVTITPSKQCI